MRQNKEKYFNETIAYRNRNPLNIRYSKTVTWQGQLGEEKGFVKFQGFSLGYRAAVKILRSYHLRGIRSIKKIIETWAPRNENNTEAYIANVVNFVRNASLRNGASTYENENPNHNPNKKSPCRGDLEGLEYCARTQINLRDREEIVNLLLAMTRVEMGANAAQLHELKTSAYIGYDLAATTPGFFKGINKLTK